MTATRQPFSDAQAILRRFGYYRASYEAAVHATSLVYRTVVGILAGLFPEALALETALEFSLKSFLELPFGVLADRYGRVRCAQLGLSLFTIALGAMFAAVVLRDHRGASAALVVLCGLLFGVGSPLVSGAVESFYQDALERAAGGTADATALKRYSLALSERHGWFVPGVALGASFAVLFVAERTVGAAYALLFNMALWAHVAWRLRRDYRVFGDGAEVTGREAPLAERVGGALRLAARRGFWGPCALQTACYFAKTVGIGYLIVTLGRELGPAFGARYWAILFSFMAGQVTLGWFFRARWLPGLVRRLRPRAILARSAAILLAASTAVALGVGRLDLGGWIAAVFLFMAAFQFFVGALTAIGVNAMLAFAPRALFASALSLQNLPGYLVAVAYSAYVGVAKGGAPSLAEAMAHLQAVSALVLVAALPAWSRLRYTGPACDDASSSTAAPSAAPG